LIKLQDVKLDGILGLSRKNTPKFPAPMFVDELKRQVSNNTSNIDPGHF
jgi:hypothetical protein